MKSFFFWITVATGVGALTAQILHPGILETVIVVALANIFFYGYRRAARSHQLPA